MTRTFDLHALGLLPRRAPPRPTWSWHAGPTPDPFAAWDAVARVVWDAQMAVARLWLLAGLAVLEAAEGRGR